MSRYSCLVFLFVWQSGVVIYAQEWTTHDSIQLQRALQGTEIIRLNEATQKAIHSGTLIRDPFTSKQLQISPPEMPIIKSLDGLTMPETYKQLKPQELPVAVYKLYVLNYTDNSPVVRKEAMEFSLSVKMELKELDKLTPIKATVDDPFTIRPAASGGFSAEDMLRSIFWPSHRAKKRNARNANAWKTYNEYE